MIRKSKFIVNRRTWCLHQFEFSAPCSYQRCLRHLKIPNPILVATHLLETDDDSASFELHSDKTIIFGTLQYITDETTLFVGIAYFRLEYETPGSLTILTATFLLLAIGLALFPFMARANFNLIFTQSGMQWVLGCLTVISLAALFLYLPARLDIDSKVNELRNTLQNCT